MCAQGRSWKLFELIKERKKAIYMVEPLKDDGVKKNSQNIEFLIYSYDHDCGLARPWGLCGWTIKKNTFIFLWLP